MASTKTGGEIVVDHLIAEGVPYMVGIPGHGCLALMDAARVRADRIKVIQVRHEQAAIHMADGYYRVTGRPLAAFTSIGPGALNCAIGLGAAYVDSTAVLLLSGEAHTYMAGRGVLQEIERQRPADLPTALAPLVKGSFRPSSPADLHRTLGDAFDEMLSGRPGPVFVSLPMDVQAEAADVDEPAPAIGRSAAPPVDAGDVAAAARLLTSAERPVILAGGGVTLASAEAEMLALAEHLGAAVVTTLQGKGCFPEDHPLYAWHAGSKGTSVGNAVTVSADVILAVGCRFTDLTASSFRHGVTFSIPPTKLIHLDIDPAEIGKNFETEIGLLGDARQGLAALGEACRALGPARDYAGSDYGREIVRLRDAWLQDVAGMKNSDMRPPTVSRFYRELRTVLARDAIVTSGSGHAQAGLLEFPFYEPRTNLTSGGFSCMGFSYPAALGAKLAAPEREVVAVVGDGDFSQTMQEMATARQYDIAAVAIVLNNFGWYSIRDLQIQAYGEDRPTAAEFRGTDGRSYSPEFARIAEGFGLHAERIDTPEAIGPAVRRALDSGQPALVEVLIQQQFPYSGGSVAGWWDVPIPAYMGARRTRYEEERSEEQPRPGSSP